MASAKPPTSTGDAPGAGDRDVQMVQRLMPPSRPPRISPPQFAPPTSHKPDAPDFTTELGYLRTWVQGLRDILHLTQAGKAELEAYADHIQTATQQIQRQIDTIDVAGHTDTIERIIVLWDQMQSNKLLQGGARLDTQHQLQLIEQLDQQCRELAFWCAYETVPDRLRQWLKETMPGYAIPFHDVFKEEIPDQEDRQRMLDFLALVPHTLKSVGGLVDPERGLVYRYEANKNKRINAILGIGLALVVATLAVWIMSMLPPLAQTGPGIATLLIGWGAVLVGVLVHVGVDQSKRLRTQGPSAAVLPINRIEMVISAQRGPILLRIAMMLVGYFTLVYSLGAPTPGQDANFLLSAFLAGYSLDSIIDLFSASADQQAAAQQANLKQKLGVT